MTELPEDALIEILARLPVKSLIRFTCVCKYWLFLIRSPEFATKHYCSRLNYLSENNIEFDSVLALFNPGCSISIFSNSTPPLNLGLQLLITIHPFTKSMIAILLKRFSFSALVMACFSSNCLGRDQVVVDFMTLVCFCCGTLRLEKFINSHLGMMILGELIVSVLGSIV